MDYSAKLITVEKALSFVKSGDQIITGSAGTEAALFLSRLHTIADRVTDVTVTNCLPMANHAFFDAQYKHSFNIDGWFYAPMLRKAHANGNVSFIPNHLHLAGPKRLAHIRPNIYVGAATMPDQYGYVSLSLGNIYEKKMIEAADLVILEINPNLPYTYGDVELHVREIDYMIEADYAIPEMPETPFSEKDALIGKHIADLIHDGDCLQLGIGGIPNAVASYLTDKKDLGVHTEMMTTGMMKLAKMGVITGARKQVDKGKIVATFALGTKELYEYIDRNPSVVIRDGAEVNDPAVIGLNDNQVSINTTLEVDLTGQCCSESIGSRHFSGTGGASDTCVGAQNSKNGRSIVALYSTAMVTNKATGEKSEISKIVSQLKIGAAVSISRNDVDMVVTEYGVAHLRGTNIRERVERLIAIAHPKFREGLWQEAYAHGIICKK